MSFSPRTTLVLLLAVSVIVPAACGLGDGGSRILPTTPTQSIVSVPVNPLLNDPNAISIGLDQTTTGTIGISGPSCYLWDPLDTYGFPCQTYRVNLPAASSVRIHLTWSAPNQTLCSAVDRSSSHMTCKNASPVDATYVVTGTTFAFAVGYEGGVPTQTIPPDFKLDYSVSATLVSASVAGSKR